LEQIRKAFIEKITNNKNLANLRDDLRKSAKENIKIEKI
jgi:hypothetical protein